MSRSHENPGKQINWAIKTFLDVIIYPLATELFALRTRQHTLAGSIDLYGITHGPPQIELGVAKNFSITIMRLPRWKRLIAFK